MKELAAHLELSPATLSLVLNGTELAGSIPQGTKDRIFEAARKFNYRPNFIARSLRSQRTFSLGVLVPELSDGYSAAVLSGVEEHLLQAGFFYFVASHRHRQGLIEHYPELFIERCVEGLLLVDTPQNRTWPVPVVSVSGHSEIDGATRVVLDHDEAATLALDYLARLGHRRVAVIKGQDFSSDTEVRWQAISRAASKIGMPIRPALVEQLVGNSPSPETGYAAAQRLLARGEPFTALFAFNDIAAIGAIRALRESGREVPADVSVVGFDDVDAAAFHHPALTTIRQPLSRMGKLAAEHLLRRIAVGSEAAAPEQIVVEPELVIRQSTAPVKPAD